MTPTKLKPPAIWVQLILVTLLSVLSGFTIMVMWGWYIVPLGLPTIGLIHALGLDMLITFIVTTKKSEDIPFWDNWIWWMVFTVLTLLLGGLLHLFM